MMGQGSVGCTSSDGLGGVFGVSENGRGNGSNKSCVTDLDIIGYTINERCTPNNLDLNVMNFSFILK